MSYKYRGRPGVEGKLSGRTLQVYLYLQRKKAPSGIREVQRDLGLSSPSVADYQIEKLVDTGLATKDSYGRVSVTARKVRVKELDSYINFGRFSVPRLACYASVFSVVAVLYVILNPSSFSIYGVLVPAAAALVLWLEAWRIWKFSLFERAENAERNKNYPPGVFPLLVPVMVALAVFVAGGAFLFQYVQEPSHVQVEVLSSGNTNQQTIEESVSLSEQKVVAAGSSAIVSSELATFVIPFAGAVVVGFLVYILARYRHEDRVLEPEQAHRIAFGTQDYP